MEFKELMEHHIRYVQVKNSVEFRREGKAGEGVWSSCEDMEVFMNEVTLGRDNRGKKRSRTET